MSPCILPSFPFSLPLLRPAASPRRGIAIAISSFLPWFLALRRSPRQAQPCRAPSPETALSSPPFWYPSHPLYRLLTQLRLLLGSRRYKRRPSACCLCCCGTGIGSLYSVMLQLMKGNLVLVEIRWYCGLFVWHSG